jgi:outer membrane protein W
MELTRVFVPTALVALTFAGAPHAMAEVTVGNINLGNFIVRMGASYVRPDEDSTALKFAVLQHWDFYDTSWEMDSDITWNISGVWKPLENWGVELMYIGSADYDITLTRFKGFPGRDRIHLGDFAASSSNVFINWYPLNSTCLVQPYMGIGLNYTDFHDESLHGEMQFFLVDSGLATGGGSFGLGHSWGATAQAGVDFNFGRDRSWLVNAAVLYIDSDSDVLITFPTQPGYDRLYADFDYNPWVINLGVGYRF